MKKILPKGIIVISIFLVMMYGLLFISSFITLSQTYLPEEKKLEFMKSEQYASFNLKTVDEFDAHFRQAAMATFTPWNIVNFLIVLTLAIGLLFLKNWARIAMIIYLIGNSIIRFLWFKPAIGANTASLVGAVFFSIINILIIIYLVNSRVRKHFTATEERVDIYKIYEGINNFLSHRFTKIWFRNVLCAGAFIAIINYFSNPAKVIPLLHDFKTLFWHFLFPCFEIGLLVGTISFGAWWAVKGHKK